MKRVLVLCLGNICRSPIGEELIRLQGIKNNLPLEVDSAGTIDWHAGKAPDPRSQAVMRTHGLTISDQQSRPLKVSDFHHFDIILCMDRQNLIDAKRIAQGPAELHLFVAGMDVPDPYYVGEAGFEQVYTMLEKASIEWIEQWSEKTNS